MTDNRNEEDLRAERRAKMAELRRKLEPGADEGRELRTSAPTVRNVDQFRAQYGAADRRAATPDKKTSWRKEPAPKAPLRRRPQQVSTISKAEEDMILDSESNDLEQEISGILGEEKKQRSSSSSSSGVSSGGLTSSSRTNEGFVSGAGRRNQDNREAAAPRPDIFPTYSSNRYEPGSFASAKKVAEYEDDLDEAILIKDGDKKSGLRKSKSFSNKIPGFEIERQNSHTTKIYDEGEFKDGDPLGQSLQNWPRSTKDELASSMRSNSSVKCVYDERIFASNRQSHNNNKGPADSLTEQSYFNRMKNWHESDDDRRHSNNNGYRDFLTGSFNRTNQVSMGVINGNADDANSVQTEFEEPNRRGRSGLKRRARNFLSSSFNGLLIAVPALRGRFFGDAASEPPQFVAENGRNAERSRSRSKAADCSESECSCVDEKPKKKKRTFSCGTLFCLVAIDVFTIGLLIILYSQLHVHTHCEHKPIFFSTATREPDEAFSEQPGEADYLTGGEKEGRSLNTNDIEDEATTSIRTIEKNDPDPTNDDEGNASQLYRFLG